MFKQYKSIHFVGIGGIGMSGIAQVLHTMGYRVTGSDLKASEMTGRLQALGIPVAIGHSPANIKDAQVVVISSAVGRENPEARTAVRLGVPVIPRAEMLAELGRLKYGVLVAGSHGKTTTTSLIATLLARAGLDPTVVIGGRLNALGSNARLGRGDFLVAEADESDGSFLKLSPAIAVATNIDREHMEFFKSMHALRGAFLEFLNKVPFYGLDVLCLEDAHLRGLLPDIRRRVLTYGFREEAGLRAVNVEKDAMSVEYDAVMKGKVLFRVRLPIPGDHNVLNSLAAIGAALELDVSPAVIRDALSDFEGIGRRLELKGRINGISVYDDYGHHPTEVRATIKSLKEACGASRLIVLFQPHRFTRTRDLMEEFSSAFDHADFLLLMDIYPAGERPLEGITSEELSKAIKNRDQKQKRETQKREKCAYVKDVSRALAWLSRNLRPGDIVLTLGAGDVWKVAEELVNRLGAGKTGRGKRQKEG
ncbi:MAG: UDP-N-acetylmuramate--L-alanine ligase [Nitrospiraceae bacterium]|nr:UDP-N-acetylmuramate--L-alanine ligase [Nitrospiraceae bacterium]